MGCLISVTLAYFIGSLSFAIIISKLMHALDPRMVGSGNAGATNILRLVGKQAAIYVLLADGLKGLIAVLIGRLFHVHGMNLAFVGLITVIGHIFPIYFSFKGGKGVATMTGALFGLSFWVGLFSILVWFTVAYFTRYSSVATLVLTIAAPVFMVISTHIDYFFPVLIMVTFIIWKHWENIQRLCQRTERKIDFGKR
ncbi:glycerol-3-phosphate 1-O-acyltransferase PlsY [Coxiella endosymbiont of Amblyomma nuttalli]|uniref:glycerol-3-phosphate 1-O-acyltransferase PlsY n=1 Tax=Coxiella endosymbiont of Amblyomma nuttalli TaxID=2749996 RepID=UPI001BAC07F9|nr:glycerol-3-phosphate 1-O-acyltransferase PlsY [Coxiella endosymbiont of Amblyomma nuttalli]QTS83906.1 putative glycerol-3-phosphate acyltransferase [Coxiella endosymbiont of Amblyomma nuttalli]